MRATVGNKRPRCIYTKRPRMSINISVNSTIFQQFAAERAVLSTLFFLPRGTRRPSRPNFPARLILVDEHAGLPVGADPAAVHPRSIEGHGEVAAAVEGDESARPAYFCDLFQYRRGRRGDRAPAVLHHGRHVVGDDRAYEILAVARARDGA